MVSEPKVVGGEAASVPSVLKAIVSLAAVSGTRLPPATDALTVQRLDKGLPAAVAAGAPKVAAGVVLSVIVLPAASGLPRLSVSVTVVALPAAATKLVRPAALNALFIAVAMPAVSAVAMAPVVNVCPSTVKLMVSPTAGAPAMVKVCSEATGVGRVKVSV